MRTDGAAVQVTTERASGRRPRYRGGRAPFGIGDFAAVSRPGDAIATARKAANNTEV